MRAYTKIPAEAAVVNGVVVMDDAAGKHGFFRWRYGDGVVPRGWLSVTEHIVVALANDRVVWWRDDLTPPRCHRHLCHQIPAEMVGEATGGFLAYGDAQNHSCYVRLSGEARVRLGATFDVVPSARFSAPVRRGGLILLTSSFGWAPGQTATETDALSNRTLLVDSYTVNVPQGPRPQQPAFSITATLRHPSKAPPMPSITLCKP
jgi:hypothetical protein